MSAHFLVSWVQRGAGVGPNADARPRMQNPDDDFAEMPDQASSEEDEAGRATASAVGESQSGSSKSTKMPKAPDSPAGTAPPDVSDRVILIREVVHPAVHDVPYPAGALASPPHLEDQLTPTGARSFSPVSVRPIPDAAEPPRREPEALVLTTTVQPTRRALANVDVPLVSAPVAPSRLTDPDPAPRALVGEPMPHWMPSASAPADAPWREHERDVPARENHVEVRIGRVEILQPAAAAPVSPPPRRQPRGFGDARAARRYLDRKWY